MKRIFLSQNQFALVDDCDYERLNVHRWYALYDSKKRGYYAVRNDKKAKKEKYHIYMAREVLNAPKNKLVDHIEPERTLDNRRKNLRLSTRSENNRNKIKPSTNTSVIDDNYS
jgi:hypothetical protein